MEGNENNLQQSTETNLQQAIESMSVQSWKRLGTRIVSGLLTASMILSMLVTPVAAATGSDAPAQNPDGVYDLTPDTDLTTPDTDSAGEEERPEYSTPLVLDKNSIGFTEDMLELRVTATSTDVRYLSALDSLEEFASFFPSTLDLDNCAYLTSDLRQAINSMSETERRSHRGQALAKLKVQEQFIWNTVYNGFDYKDYLNIEPLSWGVRDATEDSAPSILCTVLISWVGPTKATAQVISTVQRMLGALSLVASRTPQLRGSMFR